MDHGAAFELWCNNAEQGVDSNLTVQCLLSWKGSAVSKIWIYPQSGLIQCDETRLFRCYGPIYPFRLISNIAPTSLSNILTATTHASLSRGEDDEYLIFLTRNGSSLMKNAEQPFGLWAELIPVAYNMVKKLQTICRDISSNRKKSLAWASASHSRLGNQTSHNLQKLASNTDLMQIIIGHIVSRN